MQFNLPNIKKTGFTLYVNKYFYRLNIPVVHFYDQQPKEFIL